MIAVVSLVAGALVLAPGTYTNEEQAYFEGREAGAPLPWTGLRVDRAADGRLLLHNVDAFGRETGSPVPARLDGDSLTIGPCRYAVGEDGVVRMLSRGCASTIRPAAIRAGEIALVLADGRETILRHARPATCWVAALKAERRADGGEDWTFARGLRLHDQGGRVAVEGGARAAVIRMRNVVWPGGPNRPSLVLYVHDPAEPARALAYAWADRGAVRVGINLRWIQASCTIDGAE